MFTATSNTWSIWSMIFSWRRIRAATVSLICQIETVSNSNHEGKKKENSNQFIPLTWARGVAARLLDDDANVIPVDECPCPFSAAKKSRNFQSEQKFTRTSRRAQTTVTYRTSIPFLWPIWPAILPMVQRIRWPNFWEFVVQFVQFQSHQWLPAEHLVMIHRLSCLEI